MRRKELPQQVEQAIRDTIRTLQPGQRMSDVADLALKWQVGSYTIKSVLEQLAQEGLIVRIPGKGTFVADPGNSVAASKITYVAVIVPALGQLESRMVNAAIDVLDARGIEVMIRLSHGNANRESTLIRQCRAQGANGFVIIPADGVTYSEELLRLAADHCPTVLWDRWLPGLNIPCVFGDHRQGASLAVEELARLGHQHIVAVSEVPVHLRQSLQERWEGFCGAVQAHALEGVPVVWNAETFVADPWQPSATFLDELRQKIVDHPEVTAYVALTAGDTLGLAKALTALHLNVPKEKSAIGFGLDNLFDSRIFMDHFPQAGIQGWTWIDQPEDQIARKAMEFLLTPNRNDEIETNQRALPMRLHQGTSCASPPLASIYAMPQGGTKA